MRLRNSAMGAALASTMLFSAAAFADGNSPGWSEGHFEHLGGGILRAVGLSDAQKQQIHQIFANHRPQLSALRTQLRTATHDIAARLYSPTPPTTTDLTAVNQLRAQLAQERLQLALEIRNVLTPDQLAKAAQTMQQLDQLRSQMRSLLNPTP